jgi:hypothetical protein
MTVCYLIGASGGFDYISFIPERTKSPILIECAVPFLAALSFLSPEEALQDRWSETFQEANAEWFFPLLRRMAAGERVSLVEIQQAHQTARGAPLREVEDPRTLRDSDDDKRA